MTTLLNQTALDYYKDGPFGKYQFTSLENVINHFMVVYVGEDKLISKIKRVDVAFHAQRALQELSFDVFKSCKAEEIVVPSSLQMILPQDYVNYTKVSWVDSSGIKHRIYPTLCNTSNPKTFHQDDNGEHKIHPVATFTAGSNVVVLDDDYSDLLIHGMRLKSSVIDLAGNQVNLPKGSFIHEVTTNAAGNSVVTLRNKDGSSDKNALASTNEQVEITRMKYLGPRRRRRAGSKVETTVTANITPGDLTIPVADVTGIEIGMYINSPGFANDNTVDLGKGSIKVVGVGSSTVELSHPASSTTPLIISGDTVVFIPDVEDSRTWENYKSNTSSEQYQDDYIDDTYWPMDGSRYGLDPQHAQANGSFYVDCNSNTINFSSNLNGKTVILDYISDSLGYEGELQVHKFAEEAMYKWISYAILSTRANTPEYIVQRYKKERFATIRNAKIRLSNIKLEEITQILRGKSKQIKH